MARWKTKSPKKLSWRQRQRLGIAKDTVEFGKISNGQRRSLDHAVDRFIREGSCRHKQPLASPCANFDAAKEGICKNDGRICDFLTEKGKRYWREYE